MKTHDVLSVVLPQFFPAHWLQEAPDLFFTDFPSRIRIGYVVKGSSGYSYVMRPALEQAGVSTSALHAAALENLSAMPVSGLSVASTPGGPEAYLTGVEDNFHAARILLPEVQDGLAQALGDEYFAAIPCRDWFICWSKSQTAEWQQRNISQARDDFIKDEYNLTPDILLRSKSGFLLHLVQQVDVE